MAEPLPIATADTNVVVAALVDTHAHHQASADFINALPRDRLYLPAHCLAESYSVLTRPNGPFRLSPKEARVGIDTVAKASTMIGLSPAQSVEAIHLFSELHGTGPLLYDYLIGRAAVMAGAQAIVTWNVKHMRALFPALAVVTPPEFIGTDQPTSR